MKLKLNHASAAALPTQPRPYVVYDANLPGFGCRVSPGGVRAWVYEYRPGGGRRASTKRLTLGRINTLPCHKARDAAEKLHHQTRLGADPAAERKDRRDAPTVAEVAGKFIGEEIAPKRKPRTAELYQGYLDRHILPSLGTKRARDVSYGDVAKLHRSLGAGGAEVTANRVVDLIRTIYRWAAKAGEVPKDTNPAVGITRFREQARERYLTGAEFARLGDALVEAETIGLPWAVDETKPTAKHVPKLKRRYVFPVHVTGAVRLLILTGCRLNEILTAKWTDIDHERGQLVLADSKTGARRVPLSAAALSVLDNLPQIGSYIIAGDSAGMANEQPRHDLNRPCRALCQRSGLGGLRLHDLRHSFASVGAGLSLGLPIIGKLLGHTQASTTSRYAHLDVDPLRKATDTIGAAIEGALTRKPSAEVVALRRSGSAS